MGRSYAPSNSFNDGTLSFSYMLPPNSNGPLDEAQSEISLSMSVYQHEDPLVTWDVSYNLSIEYYDCNGNGITDGQGFMYGNMTISRIYLD
jgi:hypothetical protein